MPFQYRIMRQGVKRQERYPQLDLYFFKPKLPGVGVKVRFITGESEAWYTNQLELKYIKNIQDLHSNQTLFQNWKKIQIPVQLQIFSKNYISKNPQKFAISQERSVDIVVKNELVNINKIICKAILGQKIQKKHFERNEDLKRWLCQDFPLVQIFAIQKSRLKTSKLQKGELRIYPLYGPTKETLWSTVSFESRSQEELRSKVKDYGEGLAQNISYPKILEIAYFK